MGDVVELPVITRLCLDPKRVLAAAARETFQRVMIIGVLEDGTRYYHASDPDGGTALWDMERTRHSLMEVADNG